MLEASTRRYAAKRGRRGGGWGYSRFDAFLNVVHVSDSTVCKHRDFQLRLDDLDDVPIYSSNFLFVLFLRSPVHLRDTFIRMEVVETGRRW